MKFTNVKQLIIKFMGGGLINFPTRFLRWVKINGDTEDDGSDSGGGSSSSDVFFSPIPVQPPYFAMGDENDEIKIVDIKDVTVDTLDNEGEFLYSKESLVSIGVDEEGLDNLEQISYSDTFDSSNENKGLHQLNLKNIIIQNNLLDSIQKINNSDGNGFLLSKFKFERNKYPVIYKIGDNVYKIFIITSIL